MSGGHFDYGQYRISQIADELENELENQGKPIPDSTKYLSPEYYEKYPEEAFNMTHREDVQKVMEEGVYVLRRAFIYAQRIDWYLSGDDGEDSLISRLKSELEELETNIKNKNK